jgi:hypothetical protein
VCDPIADQIEALQQILKHRTPQDPKTETRFRGTRPAGLAGRAGRREH